MQKTELKTPIGTLYLAATSRGLKYVQFSPINVPNQGADKSEKAARILAQAKTELIEYFAGKAKNFSVPFDVEGTEFQTKAWLALTKIPYGKTISYQEQAKKLGSPKAFRAVGQANHHNPLAIVVPCHRVISKSGKLTGYAGGLNKKQFLLQLESAL